MLLNFVIIEIKVLRLKLGLWSVYLRVSVRNRNGERSCVEVNQARKSYLSIQGFQLANLPPVNNETTTKQSGLALGTEKKYIIFLDGWLICLIKSCHFWDRWLIC